MKRRLQVRALVLGDLETTLWEREQMLREECRTIQSLIHQAALRDRADQRLEWLDKLVSATRLQYEDAERRLQALRSESK